jgi:outer membrane protein W
MAVCYKKVGGIEMKRCVIIFALIAIAATGAFAQEISFSAGGGLFTDMSFGNGMKSKDDRMGLRNISFGPYAFFDATFVEAAITLGFGSITATGEGDSKKIGNVQQFGFTVLGKYPVDMDMVTVFPLFGISYNMVLAGKYDGGTKMEKTSEKNQFGILAGAGADYDLNSNLYIRGEIMLQMRFASKEMKDTVALFKVFGGNDINTTLGIGPVIRVGIGYRL